MDLDFDDDIFGINGIGGTNKSGRGRLGSFMEQL